MKTTALPSSARAYSPTIENLRRVLIIRSLALLGQAGVLGYVLATSQDTANYSGVIASLLVLALLTGASLWRTTKQWPVADKEFLAQLLFDILGWGALMYFTGGANNPFVSYFIVPVIIAAAVLPRRLTWFLGGTSILAYTLLLYVHQPFAMFTPHAGMNHQGGGRLHVLGMWFNFLFSVGLITFFIVRMASTLRRQEAAAVTHREDLLRNDQIIAVASLAAGTAHELGTPLSTMAVLLDEMLADDGLSEQAREDCELLKTQVSQCKTTMTGLTRTAQLSSVDETEHIAVGEFAHRVLERWAVRRPGIAFTFTCDADSPTLNLDLTMAQAIENILNNAANAGSEKVTMEVNWDSANTYIRVRDWGSGISADRMAELGKPIIHADRTGMGIGLLLSQAAVERYGGSIELRNIKEAGVMATLSLPIQER